MKNSRFVWIVLLLLFGYQSEATAQSYGALNAVGNGARAAGMGFAFTGLADDATAIAWNSAGMTQLYSMEASFMGRLKFGTIEIEGADEKAEVSSDFIFDFASFVIPLDLFDKNIVAGVAIRSIYDNTLTLTLGDNEFINKGGVYAFSPAIAIELNEIVSVGAVLNGYTGKWEATSSLNESIEEEEYSGSNFDIGALFKMSESFSVGANFSMPYVLTTTSKTTNGFGVVTEEENETSVPFFWTAGILWRPRPSFSVTFDIHQRDWSKSEDFEDAPDDIKDLLNVSSFHLGLEYVVQSGKSLLPLRLGFYSKPFFLQVADETAEEPEQLETGVVTLGMGIVMGGFNIDFSGEFESFEQTTADFGEFTLKRNDFRLNLGMVYHFE